MSGKQSFTPKGGIRVQNMSYKQHITPTPPISTPPFKHPSTHHKENLSVNDGSSRKVNAKQLILYKDDVNTYP